MPRKLYVFSNKEFENISTLLHEALLCVNDLEDSFDKNEIELRLEDIQEILEKVR